MDNVVLDKTEMLPLPAKFLAFVVVGAVAALSRVYSANCNWFFLIVGVSIKSVIINGIFLRVATAGFGFPDSYTSFNGSFIRVIAYIVGFFSPPSFIGLCLLEYDRCASCLIYCDFEFFSIFFYFALFLFLPVCQLVLDHVGSRAVFVFIRSFEKPIL